MSLFDKKLTPGPWRVFPSMPECIVFDGPNGTENLFQKNVEGYYCCRSYADSNAISQLHELLRIAAARLAELDWKETLTDAETKQRSEIFAVLQCVEGGA